MWSDDQLSQDDIALLMDLIEDVDGNMDLIDRASLGALWRTHEARNRVYVKLKNYKREE